ncbi:MAG: TerB family tellurite resistance protein [Maricaulaceae bacterium]
MIFALLGALATVGVIIWRLTILMQVGREAADAAQGLANLPRKMRFQSRASKAGVEVINDPREAATLMMLDVARAGGEVTASQKAVIRAQMAARFELPEAEADEMLTQVAWLSRDLPEPGAATGRMVRLMRETVTPEEMAELSAMMRAVAFADGDPTEAQLEVIDGYKRAALV